MPFAVVLSLEQLFPDLDSSAYEDTKIVSFHAETYKPQLKLIFGFIRKVCEKWIFDKFFS